jgi:ABC-type polysaccharide/polyol phosphate transport system ATPase subunit
VEFEINPVDLQIDTFRAQGKTIIFVSHSAEDVKNICDRACVLNHGSLIFLGNADDAIERYHEILTFGHA